MDIAAAVAEFAAEVGTRDPVAVVGLGTRRAPLEHGRVVRAPAGIVRVEPDEMILECGAGTPLSELHDALRAVGQRVALPEGGTIGGALAVGRSGPRRLGDGPIRDTLLHARFVNASGEVVVAGGQTVKNVSGFDLCRTLVGSWGTLGFVGSVIVRTQPIAEASSWWVSKIDPTVALRELYRPTTLLWDREHVWALLEGHPDDCQRQAERLGMRPGVPPELPLQHRWSVSPNTLLASADRLGTGFVAELGVGVVHHVQPQPERQIDPVVVALNRRIKSIFDPEGRLNPGLDPLCPTAR